jgi:uncharacterized protein YcbX
MTPGTQVGTLVSIHRYPVKSMMGEELISSRLGARGLEGDRRFALADSETGKIASAKNPAKWSNLFDFRATYLKEPETGQPPTVRITMPSGEYVQTGDGSLDAVLSAAVGRPARLLSIAPDRSTLEEYWPDVEGLARRDEVSDEALPSETFFDCAVVHFVTTATLSELRRLYPKGQIEARRFRPNLVVGTVPELVGFAEGDWSGREVSVGNEVRLKVTGPCGRCVMTTLAQGDLPRDIGVLRTAARYNKAQIGAYASVLQGGTVRRGDPVRLYPE